LIGGIGTEDPDGVDRHQAADEGRDAEDDEEEADDDVEAAKKN